MSRAAHTRIEGLVVWRALLMLCGLILHATMGYEDYLPFTLVNIVSGSFRMGTFFLISGLLTGFAMTRHVDGMTWMRRRLLRLSIPTGVGVAITCASIALISAGKAQQSTISIHHMWFMVALVLYTLLAWAVHRIDSAWPLFRRVENGTLVARLRQSLLLVGTGSASFVLMIHTAAATSEWSGDLASLSRQLPLVTGYAPTFLLGFACGRAPSLRRIFIAGRRVPAIIIAAVIVAHLLMQTRGLPERLSAEAHDLAFQTVLIAGAAWCPPAASALILRSALAINRVPAPLSRLADASLTMYLLHYPLMMAIRQITLPHGPVVQFLMLLAIGGGAAYAIHRRIVMPSRWTTLLLNGRLPIRDGHRSGKAADRPAMMEGGELLLPGAPRTAGIPFCCPVGPDRAILE